MATMYTREELETWKFIKTNKELFDEIQDKYDKTVSNNDRFIILNYKKILNDICDYLEGYLDYNKSEDDRYGNKVLASTAKFYDSIFFDKRYKMQIQLEDFPSITEDFLEGTKELQDIILKVDKYDNELHGMMIMTNNQYRKISKVFHDDMELYLWLAGFPNKIAPTDLRQKYKDKSTPVMHKKGS